MNENRVDVLERRLGIRLPNDYRQCLCTHTEPFLEPGLVFRPPRSGLVDELLTADRILQNAEKNVLGIPERSLLHIGSNLMGGYLYIKLSEPGFGEVHYAERMMFRETFPSFSAFLAASEPGE